MKIWNYTFVIRDTVMVRQVQALAKFAKQREEGTIDDIDMAVKTICSMLVSIEGGIVSEDWILDNLDAGQLGELSQAVMEKVNEFVKKNQTLSTNTKLSSDADTATSPKSGV